MIECMNQVFRLNQCKVGNVTEEQQGNEVFNYILMKYEDMFTKMVKK